MSVAFACRLMLSMIIIMIAVIMVALKGVFQHLYNLLTAL